MRFSCLITWKFIIERYLKIYQQGVCGIQSIPARRNVAVKLNGFRPEIRRASGAIQTREIGL